MQLTRNCLLMVVVAAGGLRAQNPEDFALKMEPVGTTGAMIVGSWAIDGVQGWSWGVCHDPAYASLGECVGQSYPVGGLCSGACARLSCPAQMMTLKNGAAPDFNTVNVYPNGVTQGVV